jgi:hypothetical protein
VVCLYKIDEVCEASGSHHEQHHADAQGVTAEAPDQQRRSPLLPLRCVAAEGCPRASARSGCARLTGSTSELCRGSRHPTGWNWFSVEVADLAGTVDRVRAPGVHVRTELISGVGGKEVVLDDPSGNPVELFEPTRAEARLTHR